MVQQPTDKKRIRRDDLHSQPAWVFKLLYAIGLGTVVGQLILLLTTTGRKTGLPRVTPLVYEEIDGAIHVTRFSCATPANRRSS